MKGQMTSNLYDPYRSGYTRITMVLTKRDNFSKFIGVNL